MVKRSIIILLSCAALVQAQVQIEILDPSSELPLQPGEQEVIIQNFEVSPSAQSTNAPQKSLDLKDLPPSVRGTIQSHGGVVQNITRKNLNGRFVYEVNFRNSTRLTNTLYLAQDGLVIREPAGASKEDPASAFDAQPTRVLALGDVPPVVQDVVRSRAAGARLRISQKEVNGSAAYEVQFARGGAVHFLEILADGTILNER